VTALLAAVAAAPADWYAVFGTTSAVMAAPWLWVGIAMWTVCAIHVGYLVASARLYAVDVHERGIDVASGLFHRSRQFIWFFQMPVEAQYTRSGAEFLTRTASLHLLYNDLTTNKVELNLAGVGTPCQVEEVRMYIEERRVRERTPMRGPFT
jgi:hypothetical protein